MKNIFFEAYRIRQVEYKILDFFQQGKVMGTTHTCIGQELSAVLIAGQLKKTDIVFSNHRCHGHFIAKTRSVEPLVAEILGKQSGACRGIGGSQHLCAENFYSNGVQGGATPIATGVALAEKMNGSDTITVAYIGDGTLGEGVFYESMNVASLEKLRIVYVVENNKYSQSTAQAEVLAGEILKRGEAFGLKTHKVSTWDFEQMQKDVENLLTSMRTSPEPVMLEVETYRLEAHSKGDDLRDPAEIALFKKRDPLNQFLEKHGQEPDVMKKLSRINKDIYSCFENAEQDGFWDGYTTDSPQVPSVTWTMTKAIEPMHLKSLNQGLRDVLERKPNAVLLGEDVLSPYGGAFKVSKGLSHEFKGRVKNMPISEAAIVGIGTGMAMRGYFPIVEIMFGDFLTLACDQLVNHAAKFNRMYDGQVGVPMIVRAPMGGGKGYGATHSQSIEKHFAGVPGLALYMLHSRIDPSTMFFDLFQNSQGPALLIENKSLYAKHNSNELPSNYRVTLESFTGNALIHSSAEDIDLTIVAFGGMSLVAEELLIALDTYEFIVEAIFPFQVSSLDITLVKNSVEKSGKLLVIEEGAKGFDLGAEILARLVEENISFQAKRLGAKTLPIPSAKPLEEEVLPSVEAARTIAMELMSG